METTDRGDIIPSKWSHGGKYIGFEHERQGVVQQNLSFKGLFGYLGSRYLSGRSGNILMLYKNMNWPLFSRSSESTHQLRGD